MLNTVSVPLQLAPWQASSVEYECRHVLDAAASRLDKGILAGLVFELFLAISLSPATLAEPDAIVFAKWLMTIYLKVWRSETCRWGNFSSRIEMIMQRGDGCPRRTSPGAPRASSSSPSHLFSFLRFFFFVFLDDAESGLSFAVNLQDGWTPVSCEGAVLP